MRNWVHSMAHVLLGGIRAFGPFALVVVLAVHLGSGPSGKYTDQQIWTGVGIGVALWLAVELVHALTGDDPDYVGNCPERPAWIWQMFSS